VLGLARARVHPKAYLTKIRNVRAGLAARSKILQVLEQGRRTIPQAAKEAGLSYDRVSHHMRLLMRERLVDRSGTRRPFVWSLTPFGQQKLTGAS
jgi:predicted transcriptional regulator